MALVEDTELIDNEPSSDEIAIWAAVLVVAADLLALYALLKARKENSSKPATAEDNQARKSSKSKSGSRR